MVLDKGKDERIAFREKQRESAKRRALFFPSLQQFHQQILKWDYKKLDQQTNVRNLKYPIINTNILILDYLIDDSPR